MRTRKKENNSARNSDTQTQHNNNENRKNKYPTQISATQNEIGKKQKTNKSIMQFRRAKKQNRILRKNKQPEKSNATNSNA